MLYYTLVVSIYSQIEFVLWKKENINDGNLSFGLGYQEKWNTKKQPMA